ncbi:hypothetical protein N7582_005291 [Saccharomyces uvarum]|uniref:Uncharacterized protein n=1 Tax=Saccharomyces uvarum TaxID=230603 RepID=A0AA35NMH3_SACUV|nr:hypothetical protein N7582_005291 [Saccharomyces uvarum]CAI4051808.1 hypothetical protein SUVC_15G2550 [Saccharomyces uvarum]
MNHSGRTLGGSQNRANPVVNPFRTSPSEDRVPSRDETPRNYNWKNPYLFHSNPFFNEDENTKSQDRSVPTHRQERLPSYEEAAGKQKQQAPYPKEKKHSSGSDSHQHGHRHRRSSHNHRDRDKQKSKSRSKVKPPKNVDTIDKMDVTGLFGGSFHHDGPFDACTPQRNKDNKVAPVLAFPADGPNNTVGGGTSKKSTLDEVFGRETVDEDPSRLNNLQDRAYLYNKANSSTTTLDAIKPNKKNITQFDSKMKTELVHGPTTMGLGSTTFLDGAPASTAAIRQDVINHAQESRRKNSISRKKSLPRRHLQVNNNNLKLVKTHSGHLEQNETSDNPTTASTTYGSGYDDVARNENTGNKLLRRVKSLKTGKRN